MEQNEHVSNAVYEELKMLAAVRERCVLQFRAGNGGTVTVETVIQDVFEDENSQYLLAENGLTLQLHQLIAVNGTPVAPLC